MVQPTGHVEDALHVISVVKVRKKLLFIANTAIFFILHVAADDDNGLSVVLHALQSVEGYLGVKTANQLAAIRLLLGAAERGIGNHKVILPAAFKRLRGVLVGDLGKALAAKVFQALRVNLIHMHLARGNSYG